MDCPAIVEAALAATDAACTATGQDEACYGNHRVDATFWEAGDELAFSAPSDRVPLADLHTIRTAPLDMTSGQWGVAVLDVRANLPETLPGQAVRFLLMGDAALENGVSPGNVADLTTPVTATVNRGANLRSAPSTNANIVGGASAGDTLSLIGINGLGDWYEVALESGTAWVWGELVSAAEEDADALAALPMTEGRTRYGPMQAFYLTTGLGGPTCVEATDALIISNPTGVDVTLNVNGLEVTLGSTVAFHIAEYRGQPYLHGMLLEGYVRFIVGGAVYALENPGAVFALSLSEAGWVTLDSELADLSDVEGVDAALRNACRAATRISHTAMRLESSPDVYVGEICDAELAYEIPEPEMSSDCLATAMVDVYRRGGPGPEYPFVEPLLAGHSALVNGQSTGSDGYTWLMVQDGTWVRADMVTRMGMFCATLPGVDAPPLPPTPTPRPAGQGEGSGSGNQVSVVDVTYCRYNQGGHFPFPIQANTPFLANGGTPAWNQDYAQNSYHYFSWTLAVDGVPIGETYRRAIGGTDAPCPVGLHGWWNVPGLPPGEHTLTATVSYNAWWPECTADGLPGVQPGSTWVDSCTVTVR
jgi:uncharacterized protein YraI